MGVTNRSFLLVPGENTTNVVIARPRRFAKIRYLKRDQGFLA